MGRPTPAIYSAEASLYVFWAGVALIRTRIGGFSLSVHDDYMQHTYAPEAAAALDFYAAIDVELGRLLNLGATIGITADHGMNAKQRPDGQPNVIYLETQLTKNSAPVSG